MQIQPKYIYRVETSDFFKKIKKQNTQQNLHVLDFHNNYVKNIGWDDIKYSIQNVL